MTLTDGQTLAFYKILEQIGAGGMGEVYRAKDTRLQRDVAIKVLPEELAGDEERLRRFEREAQTLAALNHSNIAGIHGVDQEGDVCFLALELVPGEDLATRLARGPLPVNEALDVCRQIAEGLEAAHEAGVVHRDLKPANVRITPHGVVKLLDFGLAKPLHSSATGGRATGAEPDSFLVTEEGLVLGTPTYMSPEQARGKPVDRRTDIWSFGCVLYECLTGRRAFEGDSLTDILAAVIGEEPDMTRLPGLPARARELLQRCLNKDPRARLRDIGEARIGLTNTGSIADPHAPDSTDRSRGRFSGNDPRRTVALVVILGLLAAALWLGRSLATPAPAPIPPTRFTLEHAVADQGSWGGNLLAISKDARTIAYVGVPGDSRLHLREMNAFEAHVVPDTEGAHTPFFSTDGETVAFWSGGQVMKVPVNGGTPSLVTPASRLTEACWEADGRIVAVELGRLVRIDPRVGTNEPILTHTSDFVDSPSILPGSEAVLFDRNQELCIVEAGGASRTLGQAGLNPEWSATGHIVFQALDATIWAVPFDPDELRITGNAVQLIDRPALDFDVAADGTLIYLPGLGRAMELVWVDRSGEATPLDFGTAHYLVPRLAPDDSRLAVSIQEGSGDQTDLWVFELTRGARTRITNTGKWNVWAVWIHAASSLAYLSNGYLSTRAADGTGEARRLMEGDNRFEVPTSWNEEEQALAFYTYGQAGDLRIWYADGGPEDFLVTRFDERSPHFSPNGDWIAYVSDQSGVNEVYVRPHVRGQAPERRFSISTGGGGEPRWSRDGTELFYRRGSQMFAVPFESGPAPTVGAPRLLFDQPYLTSAVGRSNPNYDVAADGRFLMIRVSEVAQTEAPVVHVVRGLTELAVH